MEKEEKGVIEKLTRERAMKILHSEAML